MCNYLSVIRFRVSSLLWLGGIGNSLHFNLESLSAPWFKSYILVIICLLRSCKTAEIKVIISLKKYI